MALSEHTLTEFLQHSGRVLANVARGGVLLHRREGEDLVVMTRGQSEALAETVRVLSGAVLDPGATGRGPIATILPELAFLSADDQTRCLRELGEVASTAVATGQIGRLEEVLSQWKATGLAAWDERRLHEREDAAEYLVDAPLELPRPGR